MLTQPRDGQEGELGEGREGEGGVLPLGAGGGVHVVVGGVKLGELSLRAAGVKQGHSEIRESLRCSQQSYSQKPSSNNFPVSFDRKMTQPIRHHRDAAMLQRDGGDKHLSPYLNYIP